MKLVKIKKLSDEELNKEIALITGKYTEPFGRPPRHKNIPFKDVLHGWSISKLTGFRHEFVEIPNWAGDLNLIHKLEKNLLDVRIPRLNETRYMLNLSIVKNCDIAFIYDATAQERAEAIVLSFHENNTY